MILADTSIWIDHLRQGDPALADILGMGQVLTHPFVIGELALGSMQDRETMLSLLHRLPRATTAREEEVRHAIDRWTLFGSGIGYIDAHLLTAVALTPGSVLWTRDKRLRAAAEHLGYCSRLE